jgi:hypothetical protein
VVPSRPDSVRRISRILPLTGILALTGLFGGMSDAVAGSGCDRVASPLGSDSAVGTEAAPFRSAQKLVDSLSAGQTGCLRGGSYSSSADNVLRPTHGGSASAPLTVRSYPGERAKLVGIVEIVPGIDGITLSGLDIEGTGTGGANSIKIYSRDVVIEDNDITNAWRGRSCVMLGNVTGGGQAVRTIIRRNTFHQCGNPANGNHDHSIYAANITDGEITDNVFYDSAAYTIQFYPNAQNTRFAHNVVDGGSPSIRGGVIFAGDNSYASSNNTVEYNVIAYAATYNITSTWSGPKGSGNTAHDNCVWGGTNSNISTPDGFTAWDNTTTNPNFTDRTNHNYTLTPDSGCQSVVGYDTAAMLAGGSTTAPDTMPPSVSFSKPSSGDTLSGLVDEAAGDCAASASDDTTVDHVDFYVDGQLTNTERSSPYSCVFDSRSYRDGPHTISAKAYDAAGNQASSQVSATFANTTSASAPANQTPTVDLTRPSEGTSLTRDLTMAASASDDKAVSRVEFFVDSKRVGTDYLAPFSLSYRAPKSLSNGTHTVKAVAYDAEGLSATDSVTVTRGTTSSRTSASAARGATTVTLGVSGRARRTRARRTLRGRVRGAARGSVDLFLERYDKKRHRWRGARRRLARLDARSRFRLRPRLRAGRYRVFASYAGDGRHSPSRSRRVRFRI